MSRPSTARAAIAPVAEQVLARRAHYAAFFGDEPLPEGFGIVVGNCQAESLRIVLDEPEHPTVRIPPVHEMTAPEAERLHEIVGAAGFVVSQPVRDDYRGLPLGTRQVAASAGPHTRVVTVPVVRHPALHPFQAAIRVPGTDDDPPLVAYHDVRTLAAAAGLPVADRLPVAVLRDVAAAATAELRRRESATDVRASDLFDALSADHLRTVNHPGNAIWVPLGARLRAALGRPADLVDPGRPLLNAVRAPLEDWVVEAWGLDATPRAHWLVDGVAVDPQEIRHAHLAWYAEHPDFVRAATARLAPLLAAWRRG